jgi:SAM-dependent methyltransferase
VPALFRAYQRIVGARSFKRSVIVMYLRPRPGDRVLDLGCGPGDVVDDFPDVEYVGLDVSEPYIQNARRRFGARASFIVADVLDVDPGELGAFDLVHAHGLLHHVDDAVASRVCALAADVLVPSGRFVTADPCFTPGQSRLARLTVAKDRGDAVRTPEQYRALAQQSFERVGTVVDHSPLHMPHTAAVLVCTEPKAEHRVPLDLASSVGSRAPSTGDRTD